MPRYYFKLLDGEQVYHDGEGQMLRDDEEARHEAGVALTEIARDVLARDGLYHEFEIIVLDEAGDPVWKTKLDFEATRID